jgi:hypothetical protein
MSCVVFGVNTNQVFTYFQRYPGDKIAYKSIVCPSALPAHVSSYTDLACRSCSSGTQNVARVHSASSKFFFSVSGCWNWSTRLSLDMRFTTTP